MEELLILAGIVAGILAVSAHRRTLAHAKEIDDLRRELAAASERLRMLERDAAPASIAARQAAPSPARSAEQAVADVQNSVQPPQVVTPPPVIEAPPIIAPQPNVPAIRTSPSTHHARGPSVPPPPVPHMPRQAGFEAPPSAFMRWFTGGNPLAKVGIVLLFFGIAYLVRYAAEHDLISIEMRLTGAALISLLVLATGWTLRERSPVYGLTLQGGGIGGLYLTCFAAFRLYGLLPHSLVFVLLVVICAASVVLAIVQRAQALALLASLGGYLAPILLSTGAGDHVVLFSYYALLSAGILAVSISQAWRSLSLVGFFFSFGVGSLWGAEHYEPSLYVACQVFLALNVVMYGVVAVLLAIRHGDSREAAFIDGTLAFGTPLIGFGLQVGLTRQWEYGPALSALAFSTLYLSLAWFTLKLWPARGRRLVVTFFALGAGFATLAIPLAFSARWTSMAWALEGLGALWVGRLQRDRKVIWTGTGLLVLAGASAWVALDQGLDTPTFLMLTATLSLCWFAAAFLWQRAEEVNGAAVSRAFLTGGVLAWLMFVGRGTDAAFAMEQHGVRFALAAVSVSALVWQWIGLRLQWRGLRNAAFVLWPAMFLALQLIVVTDEHPLGRGAWALVWVLTLAIAWQILRNVRPLGHGAGRAAAHAALWILAFLIAVTEVHWRLNLHQSGAEEWPVAGMLVVCGLFIALIARMSQRGHWAVAENRSAYWLGALAPPVLLAAWLLAVGNLLDGRVPGIPFIPLLNALEAPAAFALLMGGVWHRGLSPILHRDATTLVRSGLIGLVVWWTNGTLLRTLAFVGDVSWSYDALWNSAFIQTTMAIAWTSVALVCMWLAAQRKRRTLWFAGAAALATVVAKLFLVDSLRAGGLSQAIAFIGVALLILLIGYVAPLPPRAQKEQETDP